MGGWLVFGMVLLAVAAILLVLSARLKAHSGLPQGRVLTSDTRTQQRGKPLYSAQYGLAGTPDYVVQTAHGPVPVEVKPGRTEDEPHESHLLQVLAYCLLIEEAWGKRPPYGLLRYSNNTFRVDYNRETRAHLLDVLEEMRRQAQDEPVDRNHNISARCRACGYRPICEQSLWP
jgi:CRISPR-associated exonuclease Cas4